MKISTSPVVRDRVGIHTFSRRLGEIPFRCNILNIIMLIAISAGTHYTHDTCVYAYTRNIILLVDENGIKNKTVS